MELLNDVLHEVTGGRFAALVGSPPVRLLSTHTHRATHTRHAGEVCPGIKARYPEVPVARCTGPSPDGLRRLAGECGAASSMTQVECLRRAPVWHEPGNNTTPSPRCHLPVGFTRFLPAMSSPTWRAPCSNTEAWGPRLAPPHTPTPAVSPATPVHMHMRMHVKLRALPVVPRNNRTVGNHAPI